MDSSSSWVDTSLDLNASARSLRLEAPKESTSNLIVFGRKLSVKEESGGNLVEELNRVSAENKKLTEMLTVMCESYNALQSQLMDLMSKTNNHSSSAAAHDHHHHHQAISYNKELSPSRKRNKSETTINNIDNNNNNINNFGICINGNNNNNNNSAESSSTDEESCKKPRSEEIIKAKISRVYVRTEASDTTLVVKDGYQWRKYGQKVTRDNPSPRAYFKCSYAPSCPVKKKVQRSMEDQAVVVATYEGEHNHLPPSQMEATSAGSSRTNMTLGSVPAAAACNSATLIKPAAACGPTITLDLTTSNKSTITTTTNDHANPKMDQCSSSSSPPQVKQFLVEQMASSLTKDPKFTAALAAAISGRMFSTKSS